MSKKEVLGICHICGKYGPLSDEHIPPQGAFNNQKRKLHSLDMLLNAESDEDTLPWEAPGLKYMPFQSGVNFKTLCKSCNNFTGSKYGKDYVSLIRAIGFEISKIPKDQRSGWCTIHVRDISVLAFFKQVISMFCSINEPPFGEAFRDYLLDENSTVFDKSKYRVFVYLHAGKGDRWNPEQLICNSKSGERSLVSEISTFPVGFLLYRISDDLNPAFRGCDITDMATAPYTFRPAWQMDVPFLPTDTFFTLDYRSLF